MTGRTTRGADRPRSLQPCARVARSGTRASCLRSSACGTPTCWSTVPTRSGAQPRRCGGGALHRRAVDAPRSSRPTTIENALVRPRLSDSNQQASAEPRGGLDSFLGFDSGSTTFTMLKGTSGSREHAQYRWFSRPAVPHLLLAGP